MYLYMEGQWSMEANAHRAVSGPGKLCIFNESPLACQYIRIETHCYDHHCNYVKIVVNSQVTALAKQIFPIFNCSWS